MSTNQLFLIRIPNKVDKKLLNGRKIDLTGCNSIEISDDRTATATTATSAPDNLDHRLYYSYDCDLFNDSQTSNLIKLDKTFDNKLEIDKTKDFCGYIRFRIDRKLTNDSENWEPLAKRHCVEPIETYIKPIEDEIQIIEANTETVDQNRETIGTKAEPKESPKKKKRKHK